MLQSISGVSDHAEYLETREYIMNQVDYDMVRFFLVDVSNQEQNTSSTDEVHDQAQDLVSLSNSAPNLLVAIVAPQDLFFGTARMWEAFAHTTGWSVMVFREMEDAKLWLSDEYEKQFGEVLEDFVPGKILLSIPG